MDFAFCFLMGRFSQIVVVFWSVTVFVYGSDVLKCDESTVFRVRNGGKAFCKKCPPCFSAGYGLNTTVKRLENEHGFLSCFPCVKCPDKTFREFDAKDPECRPCTLDCFRLNRYESVYCGRATPGHCGECRHGFSTESKEPNSMCNKTNKETDKPTTSHLVTKTKVYVFPQENTKDLEVTKNSGILRKIPLAILFLLVLLTILAPVAAGCYRCKKRRNHGNNRKRKSDNLANEVDSSSKLIASKWSHLGEDNLDTDGGGQARGELPTVVSINELEAMRNAPMSTKYKRETTKPTVVVLEYNSRILDKDDATLTVVADKVSGEARHEFFQSYLKIEKSKTDPEEEKWLSEKITFSTYILNVLKIWLQREDKEATLKALCNALVKANFDLVVKQVLDLPENQIETEEIKDRIEIML